MRRDTLISTTVAACSLFLLNFPSFININVCNLHRFVILYIFTSYIFLLIYTVLHLHGLKRVSYVLFKGCQIGLIWYKQPARPMITCNWTNQHFKIVAFGTMFTVFCYASSLSGSSWYCSVQSSLVWLILLKLPWTISHAYNYSNHWAVKWCLNTCTSCINRPINRKYCWTLHSMIFCLCSN